LISARSTNCAIRTSLISSESAATPQERSALALTLRDLDPLLAAEGVTELCINRPGEAFVESSGGWEQVSVAFADYEWCLRLCKLVANATAQRIDEQSPLLSASLPGGERIQVAMPPATLAHTVSITIRKPAPGTWSLDELAQKGIFARTQHAGRSVEPCRQQLVSLLERGDYVGFMRMAVVTKQNILVSGPTGSGKTTWTKALIREIPTQERLISIEDAQELVLDRHSNHVRLFYSKGGQGRSRVTPKQLLEACLRMKPDRILLAELRAEEAFDYLRNVNSGHPGSITSVHAASAELAFEQLVLLVKQNEAGREMSRADIRRLLGTLVDVVIQFGVEGPVRYIKEIWYGPARERNRGVLSARARS
jgi:type IV secretion system protein VirB11